MPNNAEFAINARQAKKPIVNLSRTLEGLCALDGISPSTTIQAQLSNLLDWPDPVFKSVVTTAVTLLLRALNIGKFLFYCKAALHSLSN